MFNHFKVVNNQSCILMHHLGVLKPKPENINYLNSAGYAYWISGAEMGYTKWAPYNEPSYNTHRRAYVQLS